MPAEAHHGGNGWSEYQRLVLAELERHSSVIEGLAKEVRSVAVDVALFKRHVESMDTHRVEVEMQMTDLRGRVKKLEEEKAHDDGREVANKEHTVSWRWVVATAIMAAGYILLPLLFQVHLRG